MRRFLNHISQAFGLFWEQHPALLYGVSLLLGFAAALSWHWALLIPLALLWLPLCFDSPLNAAPLKPRLFYTLPLIAIAYLYGHLNYQFPEVPDEGIKGTAYFEIESVNSFESHIGRSWNYKGTLVSFIPEGSPEGKSIAKNVPCQLYLRKNVDRPPANISYLVEGTLKLQREGRYALKIKETTPWIPVDGSWSLAEFRFKAKQAVEHHIQTHYSDPRTATFLTGIITGTFSDGTISVEFGRLGLQHIMAISGFHFAIVAAFFNFFLRLFFSYKKSAVILIILLCLYALFLGNGPSIQRAWIMALIGFLGCLVAKRGLALNSLGVALIAVSLSNPLLCLHLGFQFSFLTTAAILLFYSFFDTLLQHLFLKRPLSDMVEMSRLHQHSYVVLALFREALALTLAVNLLAAPMTLYIFHKFPWSSLIYNLFFPFLVSISMFFFLLAALFAWIIPPLADWIHMLNGFYTGLVLDFTTQAPAPLNVTWYIKEFPFYLFISYLCICFFIGILAKYSRLGEYSNRLKDWWLIGGGV